MDHRVRNRHYMGSKQIAPWCERTGLIKGRKRLAFMAWLLAHIQQYRFLRYVLLQRHGCYYETCGYQGPERRALTRPNAESRISMMLD